MTIQNNSSLAAAAATLVLATGLSVQASAQEIAPEAVSEAAPQWAFNVAGTSDYVFRGVSQTEEEPALSGGVDVTVGAVYAGAWASNVSFPGDDDTNAEIDLYGGVRTEAAGWTLDLGVIGYLYAGQPGGADYDYAEIKVAASRAVGPATVGAAVYYSPDFFGASEDEATYIEANAAVSPVDRLTLSGAIGHQFLSSDFDYTTWNLGAAYQLTSSLAVDVRYHDTDEHDFGDVYGSRAVASLKASF